MKRGKDEEENLNTPMFPRLHVNDRDKGGPRAPPRNKMALYEQLSIPSQRFNSSSLNPRCLGPSSSQGNSHGKTVVSPCNASPSMPAYSAEKSNSRSFNGESMNSIKHVNFKPAPSSADCRPLRQHESSNAKHNCRKRVDDDDDFRVPTFDNSENASYLNKDTTHMEKRILASSSQKPLEQTNISDVESGKHERNHNGQKLNYLNDAIGMGDHTEKSRSHPELSNTNITDRTCQELCKKGVLGGTECVNDRNDDQNVDDLTAIKDMSHSKASFSDKLKNLGDTCNRTRDASDKSMVEPILEFEISPDDVVGVIGPKQFWKARRAIVNQQRVFAIQVFELHRLIKVQKLLAASPHLLLEENPSVTPQKIPFKNLPLETYPKPQPENPNPKAKDDSQRSSEGQPPVYGGSGTYSGNPLPPPLPPPPENGTNPWGFPPPAQTWLVPVMSPSEGLIYKPYAGSWPPAGGIMGPVYGNYNPMSVQPPQQQNFPSYFPSPYSLPTVMNSTVSNSAVEQLRPRTVPRPTALTQQNSRSSCNMSFPKSDAITACPMKIHASKESELQGSTASSPGEGRDMPTRFTMAVGGEGLTWISDTVEKENLSRVIRVVPRNARSATESAARIFKSLQEERQQYEQ